MILFCISNSVRIPTGSLFVLFPSVLLTTKLQFYVLNWLVSGWLSEHKWPEIFFFRYAKIRISVPVIKIIYLIKLLIWMHTTETSEFTLNNQWALKTLKYSQIYEIPNSRRIPTIITPLKLSEIPASRWGGKSRWYRNVLEMIELLVFVQLQDESVLT